MKRIARKPVKKNKEVKKIIMTKNFWMSKAAPMLFLTSAFAFAQEIVEQMPAVTTVVVEDPSNPWLQEITKFLINLAVNSPVMLSFFAVMGFLRFILKPTFSALRKYADSTAWPKDNELLDRVEKSTAYKVFEFVVDWLGSIKLPAKK